MEVSARKFSSTKVDVYAEHVEGTVMDTYGQITEPVVNSAI